MGEAFPHRIHELNARKQFPYTTPVRTIYLASSWRNTLQPTVLSALRRWGHHVYDFRNPTGAQGNPGDNGFGWREVDPKWESWTNEQFRLGLQHPAADRGFGYDIEAVLCADTIVLLLPAGNDAHLEAGRGGIGTDKQLFIASFGEQIKPGLMYKMADKICLSMGELLDAVGSV